MDIIQQLMVEHAVLRLRFHFARETNFDAIYGLGEFVRACHARIEDELVFPKLKDLLSQDPKEEVIEDLSRLEADHKLIDKIEDQIKLKTIEGDTETLRKRIMLYMNTVESHNSGEESLIFQHWKVSDAEEQEVESRAWKIIQDFRVDSYLAITGFSEKLVERMH
jgi:hemerythrin superfamily protein